MSYISFDVEVYTNASKNEVMKLSEGFYKVRLTVPASSGQANKALISVLADFFQVPRNRIIIAHGLKYRRKTMHLSYA